MPDDLITPDNVSNEMLKDLLDAAYMDFTVDDEGDICVRDKCRVFIWINSANTVLQLSASFAFKEDSAECDRLTAVNLINAHYLVIKASSEENNCLRFRYDFMLSGGITKKALVQGIKRFASIPHDAVKDYADSIVV